MSMYMTSTALGASASALPSQLTCHVPVLGATFQSGRAGRRHAQVIRPHGGLPGMQRKHFPPRPCLPEDKPASSDDREGPAFVSTSTSSPPTTRLSDSEQLSEPSLPSSSTSSSSSSASEPNALEGSFPGPSTPTLLTPEPAPAAQQPQPAASADRHMERPQESVDTLTPSSTLAATPTPAMAEAGSSASAAGARDQQAPHDKHTQVSKDEHDQVHDKKGMDREILNIAWPMLLTLAADPIAGLVDTAFMGRLGAAQLAGVGVALSIFNTITKMFNVPLLSVATSSVASALGSSSRAAAPTKAAPGDAGAGAKPVAGAAGDGDDVGERGGKDGTQGSGAAAARSAALDLETVSDAACASIGIAVAVGLVQVLLLSQSSSLLSIWGVKAGSPLMTPTLDFLTVRCWGAPITVLMLVLQGVFRGLQDTRAPLAATIASNVLNVILAPILIFGVGWGVRGAAIATVAAQFLPCLYLLHLLSRRLNLRMSSAGAVAKMIGLIKPTGLLVLRTMAISITYATATSVAARSNLPAAAAAHQVSFQVYMACSLLSDSLSVAAQTLLAANLASGQPRKARAVAMRTLTLGGALGAALGLALAAGRQYVAKAFTSDQSVLLFMAGLMPLVALGQPLNATAFTMDGIVFGAGGFAFACMVSAAAALPAWACMAIADRSVTASSRLLWVWAGLLSLMAVRAGALGVAFLGGKGPFSRMPPDAVEQRPKLA